MRRFERAAGSLTRFWQIETRGAHVYVAWGWRGSRGSSQIEDHGFEAAATREHDRLIAKKLKAGYREVDSTSAEANARPRAAPLRKATPPVDERLVAAWGKLGRLALDSAYESSDKIVREPGVWDALTASIERGDLSLAAVWAFDGVVGANLSPRFAPDLLAQSRKRALSFWQCYSFAIVPVMRRLLEEPAAFDDVSSYDDVALDLLEVARLQVGLLPAGTASRRIKESLGSWLGHPPKPASVCGRVVRQCADGEKATAEMLVALGSTLIGEDRFVDWLADKVREALAAGNARVDEAITVAVAPSLSPAEVCRLAPSAIALGAIAETWSAEDLVVAALATRITRGAQSHLVAGTCAMLALARDPGLAAEVEPALQIAQLRHPMAPTAAFAYSVLSRTDPAWLRSFLTRRVFGEDANPAAESRALGLVLLGRIDPSLATCLSRAPEAAAL